jgi:hypothetical protein
MVRLTPPADQFGTMNADRPKLLRKRTFLLPLELNEDLEVAASIRGVSVNEVLLNALENEFSRQIMVGLPFALDYYRDIRPLLSEMTAQGYRSAGELIGYLLRRVRGHRLLSDNNTEPRITEAL